jgi:hypothetical protein
MPKYDVHPGVAMVQKWVAELPAKTGRSLEQWAEVLRATPEGSRKDRVAVLKEAHGLGTVTAEQIFEYTFGQQTWDGDPASYLRSADAYVAAQYAGPKAALLPIFETVVAFARSLGDVRVCPCKTIVPLYRKRVFAELRAATRTRIELALALGEVPFEAPLEQNPRAKGNDRLRHRIALTRVADFDAGVKKWLRAAFRADK